MSSKLIFAVLAISSCLLCFVSAGEDDEKESIQNDNFHKFRASMPLGKSLFQSRFGILDASDKSSPVC